MYSIGENILYGSGGVMTVVDIREEKIGNDGRKYYVLRPYEAHSEALTFVPTDSERLTSLMRPLFTREQAESFLDKVSDIEPCEWISDNRKRSERFKNILESGDRAMIVSMVFSIMLAGERREAEGKKNFLSDDGAMKKAEKLILSELSVVLEITEDEARARFDRARSLAKEI